MPGFALACAANAGGGGKRRASISSASMACVARGSRHGVKLCFAEAMPSRSRSSAAMVRWSDGLYGGLIAGLVSALFFLLRRRSPRAGAATISSTSRPGVRCRIWASRCRAVLRLIPALRARSSAYCYAIVASRSQADGTAPTSACGSPTGLSCVLRRSRTSTADLHVTSYTRRWEALLGDRPLPRLVISEYITIAHRRHLAGLDLTPGRGMIA